MSFLAQIPVLDGALVRLEPLTRRHAADLAVAAEEDRGSYRFTVVPRAGQVADYLAGHAGRVRDGMLAPFAQICRGSGRAVGVTAKLLLCEYAFETLGVVRVGFSADARNERSRHAIAGLGARFEGVLRQWSPSWAPGEEGLVRDSAIFSVIAAEWPATKAALRARLARPGLDDRDRLR